MSDEGGEWMVAAVGWRSAFIDWLGKGLVGSAEWERRREMPSERNALVILSALVALAAVALYPLVAWLGVLVARALWAVVWFFLSVWVPMSILGILIGVLVL